MYPTTPEIKRILDAIYAPEITKLYVNGMGRRLAVDVDAAFDRVLRQHEIRCSYIGSVAIPGKSQHGGLFVEGIDVH